MKKIKFRLMDPREIIAVVILLIVLGIGTYAFFMTTTSLKSTRETPRGNYGTVTTGTAIGDAQFSPAEGAAGHLYIPVSSSASNVSTAVQVEAYNVSLSTYVQVQALGAANGTFMSNNTYRVEPHTVIGSVAWTYMRINYSVVSAYTSTNVNQSFKSLQNSSRLGGTVFGIIGIVITISSIMLIIFVIRKYMGPK